jgi:DNA-binding NarL/FixJ family response regulator
VSPSSAIRRWCVGGSPWCSASRTTSRSSPRRGSASRPSITKRLIGQFTQRLAVDTATSAQLRRLTDREREVLLDVAQGASNSEISAGLFIGPATVTWHVSSLLTKLGLRDRTQLVVFAYESGLVKAGRQDGDR